MRETVEPLAAIRDSLNKADQAFDEIIFAARGHRSAGDYESIFAYYIDQAFLELCLLLEALDLTHMLARLQSAYEEAKQDLSKAEWSEDGDAYSVSSQRLGQFLKAVESTYGAGSTASITKDLIEIVRATVYSITDERCFATVPDNEQVVHLRIEAVLRCVFPDLRHKPPIAKPIKNFEPDTGLPSVQTLIEYKYVATRADVKRVADEILADTRAYVSKDWNRFLYVVYETRRLKPENEWNQLMRQSGVPVSTEVIVVYGEEPKVRVAKKVSARKATR